MGTESTGFEPEPFSLAALAGQEQLQERIRTLENERDGKVREALLSLAAEFEARAEARYGDAHIAASVSADRLAGIAAGAQGAAYIEAARIARVRASGSAPSGHSTSPQSDAERAVHTPGGPEAPEGSQGVADGAQ
jgi:hypothetical protein